MKIGRSAVVCVACRQSHGLSTRGSKKQLPWFRNRCDKHHYHYLLLVLLGKVGVSVLVFVLRVIVFHVIIYVAMLYINYPRCGDCAFSASFVRSVLMLAMLPEKVWS